MKIDLFEALAEPLREHAALVSAGVDSEQAASIVFEHWPVEDEDYQTGI